MDADELRCRIAAFPTWHYGFEFDGGVTTPLANPSTINRHEQRRRYFFEPLLTALGGSLRGRRVLDLGCNAGFWSLQAMHAGADFVLGLDIQDTFIQQAKLVFEASRIDPARYSFERANVFERPIDERFDVVLCLGLFEQTAKPLELFELMASTGAEVIVIDSEISRAKGSVFDVERLLDADARVTHDIVLLPSRRALVELAAEFDFEALALEHRMTSYAGLEDYRKRCRLAFICSRGGSISLEPQSRRRRRGAGG